MVDGMPKTVFSLGQAFLLLFATADCRSGPTSGQCGDSRVDPGVDRNAVVNGSDSFDPHVVDLTAGQALAVGAVMTKMMGSSENSCTATLITPSVVLTAGHCVTDMMSGGTTPASQLAFAVGQDVSNPDATFAVASVSKHPSYRMGMGGSARNDIGVLVLQQPATEVLPALEPIPVNCTPLVRSELVGQNVQNGGYGITQPQSGWNPPPPNHRKYWTVEEVTDLTDFDFVVYGHGQSSVCNGDSGGPSLWTMPDGVIRVVGTVSWGDPSCVDYDHFARTDDNCDFIRQHLESCGDVTEQGRCDGDFAEYCDNETLVRVNCAAGGNSCGATSEGLHRCLDACQGETAQGRCDGHTAVYCEGGQIQRVACADSNLACGTNESGQQRCVDSADRCAELGNEGACEDDDALWCDDGTIRRRRCADCDQVCGYSEAHAGHYCLDP